MSVRTVFESMGTTISITYADSTDAADSTAREALEPDGAVEHVFDEFDRRFSLYRPDSELARVNAGRLRLADSSDALREVYAAAIEWRSLTGGAFSPNRPDGAIDLNGIVKAIAIERAAELLDTGMHFDGRGAWLINAGGDVLSSGGHRVGIVDPMQRDAMLTSLRLDGTRRAVATSGSAERGDHIWGRADFAQVTVVADDIITADVYATAIVSGGAEALDRFTSEVDIDVLTVDRDGALRATAGIRTAIAA